MSGTTGATGNVLSISELLNSLRDGQPARSITPQVIRNVIASIAALSGVTSLAGKSGPVQLVHTDLTDWLTFAAGLKQLALPGTTDPASTTGKGTSIVLFMNTVRHGLWVDAGTSQAPNWQAIAPGLPPPPTPVPSPPSPSPSPSPSPPPSPSPSPSPSPTPANAPILI